MAKEKTITIDDKEYTIVLLPAGEGLVVSQNIISLVAPAIGTGFDGIANEANYLDSGDTFNKIASDFIGQMGQVNVRKIIEKLLEGASVDSNTIDFDNHFAGNYGVLVKLIEFALKENFSSFFMDEGLREKLMNFFSTLTMREETAEASPEE